MTHTESRMKKCSRCDAKHFGKGFCRKHYDLIVRSEIAAAYRDNNPEKRRAAVRKWRANNREKDRMLHAAWMKNHPDVRVANEITRRARKASNGGKASAADIAKLLVLQRGKCAICWCAMDDAYTVDHILPIVLGGSGNPSNLQLLCRHCNCTKGATHPIDFMQKKGFLV